MTDLTNNIFAICKSEAEIQAIAAANTPLYVPVFGYGDRVALDRTISRDPDKDTEPIHGTFVAETDAAYCVHIDGEIAVDSFSKKLRNGAPNWRITRLTETTK